MSKTRLFVFGDRLADCDLATAPGVYSTATATANMPPDIGSKWGTLEVLPLSRSDLNECIQRWTSYSVQGTTYVRRHNSSGFTEWVKVTKQIT